MTDSTTQQDQFDRLLSEMPRISEVVNSFTSEKAQRIALRALVSAAGLAESASVAAVTGTAARSVATPTVTEQVTPVEGVNGSAEPDTVAGSAAAGKPAGRAKPSRKPNARKNFRAKDINSRPEGKPALRDFFAEKQPANFYEKNLVFVYYLEEFLDVAEVDLEHVLGAYAAIPEKAPTDPENSLLKTASTKKWLDTSNLKAIKTTHLGREMVKYDMPAKKASKAA